MAERAKIQHVEDLTGPPVEGQRYLVPTVLYPWFGKTEPWPVMGPKHTDLEHIGFEPEHYHVDIRFLTGPQVRRIEKAAYGRDIAECAGGSPLATRGVGEAWGTTLPHPVPIVKRLLCRSDGNDYPLWSVRRQGWYPKLAGAYAGRRCGRNAEGGLICPHKGFALGSLKPDEHGRVVCPLHGLVIDVQASAVVEHDGSGGGRG